MTKALASLAAMLVVAAATTALAGPQRDYRWQLTPTGTTSGLRGLSAVSSDVAWVSGSGGTVLRTLNRGATWQNVSPPGTSTLGFRDVEAFDAENAVIMSIGTGSDSRVYWTADGGAHWTLAFTNDHPDAFYDCMTFFDRKRGLALSDPVDGKFRIISTSDGGRSWRVLGTAGMPAALPGEFAFAASGQCLVSAGGKHAWFATGGGAQARVFRTDDRGLTWEVSATPMRTGPTAGIYALAFRDPNHGIAVGGDFTTPTVAPDAMARTSDGGVTWRLVTSAPNQYRSGVHWITGRDVIAVGPSGSDASFDQGRSWHRFDSGSFDTIDCANPRACWASGTQGRAAYLVRTP